MAEVWIPPQMQRITRGQQRARVPGNNVRQLIDNLDKEFPGLKKVLYDEEEDDLMPGLAVIIDGEASQLGLLDRVSENSEVHFLPAIGGGVL